MSDKVGEPGSSNSLSFLDVYWVFRMFGVKFTHFNLSEEVENLVDWEIFLDLFSGQVKKDF